MKVDNTIMWIAGKDKILDVTIVRLDKDGQPIEESTTMTVDGFLIKIKEY